jgi:peptide deformylase
LLPIKIYGEEVLRQTSKPVENIDGEIAQFLEDMNQTMLAAKGLGLAANQVGRTLRAFSVDLSQFDVLSEPKIIINPEIVEMNGDLITGEEGCLSFPGLYQMIARPRKIVIKSINLDGNEYFYEAEGLIARVFLHEIDHLNGTLFIDKLSAAQRNLIKGKLQKIKAGERI